MTNYDVVKKLIGVITPAGDASRDGQRLENLKATCELIEKLMSDVAMVAGYRDSYEASVKKCGVYADEFIKSIVS